MKTKYESVFAAHVASKLNKAKELGISASWTTANHLDALAATICETAQDGIADRDAVRDVLGECYNVSAFQQMLAKKFDGTLGGHFQREAKKSTAQQADDVFAELAKQG
jgi:hypothetical protein